MTPDAKDLCVFAVKRGDMKNRLDINYNLPQYTMLEEKLYQTFGEDLKRISDIADVICGPFGSAIKNTDYQDSGIPLVRITNINKDGYMNYDDLIYISEKLGDSLSKTQVSNGDIVADSSVLDPCFLKHHTVVPAQRFSRHVANLLRIHENFPAVHVVKAHQKVDQRRLAGAGPPHDRDPLAAFRRQR